MDKFSEGLIRTTVPGVVRTLGIPHDVAELAVRHAFECQKEPCEVYDFLLDRVNASTSRVTGVPQAQVTEAVAASAKAAADTLVLQLKLGRPVGFDELQAAYDNSGPALDLTMDILKGARNDQTQ